MLAATNIKRHCKQANQALVQQKVATIKQELTTAEQAGNTAERDRWLIEQMNVLKLLQKAQK